LKTGSRVKGLGIFGLLVSLQIFSILCINPVSLSARHRKPKKHKNTSVVAPIRRERQSKEAELARLRSEIAKVQAQLREHELREKASKKNLGAFNKRTQSLKHIIASLEAEEAEVVAEREEVSASIVKTNSNLDSLKRAYASNVRNFYLNERHDSTIELAEAQQIDNAQSARRQQYYAHLVGEAHAMNRTRLDSTKQALTSNKEELSQTLNAQEALIAQRANEQSSIEQKKQAEEERLAEIQASKAKLKRELQQRTASAKRLEGIIDNLVAKEEAAVVRRKREKSKSGHKKPVHEEETPETADLPGTSHPHSLKWPVNARKILQGYGEHRNRELNTITMNLGIEIATPKGSSVSASAGGVVSLVSSLPGYGTIIVLRHAGGLHTVYADLDAATVSRGATVHSGDRIGRSGVNTELGPSLHFEVWKGKSKQNPLGWLR
jgi:septal ring factor EnvC (AmiA/AmiB activator)